MPKHITKAMLLEQLARQEQELEELRRKYELLANAALNVCMTQPHETRSVKVSSVALAFLSSVLKPKWDTEEDVA